MRTLAIDPGTVTGFCFHDGEDDACGTFSLEEAKKAKMTRGGLYRAYSLWLLTAIEKFGVDTIVYEMPHGRNRGQEFLAGLAAVIEACDNKAAVLKVNPMTIKKFATGSGRAAKEDMIQRAIESGATVSNEHEADAYWILRYFLSAYEKGPSDPIPSVGAADQGGSGPKPH